MAYQRRFSRFLEKQASDWQVVIEPWIEFEDSYGHGWASPDIILFSPEVALVLECKLTYYPEACEDLRRLYVPLVRDLEPTRKVGSAVVFYNPGNAYSGRSTITSLRDLPGSCERVDVGLWHWMRR